MVRIRLRRMGAKKKPFYRIVVADKRSPRDGRFIETIGTYNPLTEPETVTLESERASYWLGVGAQPSESVARLLRKVNLLDESGTPIPYSADDAEAVHSASNGVSIIDAPEANASEASAESEAAPVEAAA